MPGTGVGGGRGGALVTGLLCPFPSLRLPGPLREAVEWRDGPDCREAQPPVPGDSEHLRVQHRALSHRGRATQRTSTREPATPLGRSAAP